MPSILGEFSSLGDKPTDPPCKLNARCISSRSMLHRLDTVDDVITKLGGPTEVGRLTGKTPQAVWNWGPRGRMAPDVFLIMSAELERRGFTAPAELWSINTPAEAAE